MFDWAVEKKTLPEAASRLIFRSETNSLAFIHLTIEPTSEFIAINHMEHVAIEFNRDQINPHIWGSSMSSFDYLPSNQTTRLNEHTLKNLLGYLKIYKPNPELITKPHKLSSEEILEADCGNIIPFIFNLSQNYKRVFRELENNLHKSVGDIVSIGTPSVESNGENKLRLKFFDKDDNDFWASEVSEGVLYFVALLCIINQPNPPKLLLLEEPEKGIHPRRIREVMDFIFRLAEEKDVQVILTTHNEHVLDEFATRPEAVFVFDKDDDGATYVKNLQRDIIDPTNARNGELDLDPVDLTSNLSENWLYGLLGGVPAIL
ncbi:hypothetical protein GCM10027578_40690 [Spirosoma luteolum]